MLNERLGINVKKYRKAKWMTQEQLANLSGISLTEIRAYVSTSTIPYRHSGVMLTYLTKPIRGLFW